MEKFWKDFIIVKNGKCFREQCECFIKSERIEMYFDYGGKVVEQISFFRIFENFDKTKFCVLGDNGEIIFAYAMIIIQQIQRKLSDEDFDILQKSMNDLYNYNLSLSNDCYEEILYAKYVCFDQEKENC